MNIVQTQLKFLKSKGLNFIDRKLSYIDCLFLPVIKKFDKNQNIY